MKKESKMVSMKLEDYVIPEEEKEEYDRLSKILSEEQMLCYKSGLMRKEMYKKRTGSDKRKDSHPHIHQVTNMWFKLNYS